MVDLLTGDSAKLRDEVLNRVRAELVGAAENAVDHSRIYGHGHNLHVRKTRNSMSHYLQ